MRKFNIIFLISSIVLVFVLLYSLLNTVVSIKYEIDEVRCLSNSVHIDAAESYLRGQITLLKYFIYYVLITIVFVMIYLFKK